MKIWMKRFCLVLICLTLGSPLTGHAIENTAYLKIANVTTYTVTSMVDLKISRSKKSKTLVRIPKGKAITYIENSKSWSKVKYSGKVGYIPSSIIKKVTKPVKKKPVHTTVKFKVKTFQTTSSLNIRTIASPKGKYVTTIPKGTKLLSSESYNGWYRISYKGKTGWVSGLYIREVKIEAKPKPILKAPTWNSKEKVSEILSKEFVKTNSRTHMLYFDSKELGDAFFLNSSNGKAQLTLDGTLYYPALTLQPSDFGQSSYEYAKKMLVKFNNSISVYADSQVGSAHSKSFQNELEYLALNTTGSYNSRVKTIGGKTFEFRQHNASYMIIPK